MAFLTFFHLYVVLATISQALAHPWHDSWGYGNRNTGTTVAVIETTTSATASSTTTLALAFSTTTSAFTFSTTTSAFTFSTTTSAFTFSTTSVSATLNGNFLENTSTTT